MNLDDFLTMLEVEDALDDIFEELNQLDGQVYFNTAIVRRHLIMAQEAATDVIESEVK